MERLLLSQQQSSPLSLKDSLYYLLSFNPNPPTMRNPCRLVTQHPLTVALIFGNVLGLALGDSSPSDATAASLTSCRCLYGQSCYPGAAAFASLSSRVSQPLVHPTPVASPCYTNPSSSNCATVQANFADAIWRTNQPGAYEFQNFESYIWPNGTIDACYLDTTLGSPCKQGSIPPIGVDARTPSDVQAAVIFARNRNLRLVIKNTGHDYQGRSAGRGAFMIWTHNMKGMSYNAGFSPAGGPSSTTYQGSLLTFTFSGSVVIFFFVQPSLSVQATSGVMHMHSHFRMGVCSLVLSLWAVPLVLLVATLWAEVSALSHQSMALVSDRSHEDNHSYHAFSRCR